MSMRARLSQAAVVCALAFIMLGASDPNYRFNKLGHEIVCVCGDNEILLECNHVFCPDAPRMIAELKAQMATGASDEQILKWFADKYGPTVLAAPLRGGFDNVAWIVPYALLGLATLGTGVLVYYWRRRAVAATLPLASSVADADPLRERIRRETEEI